MRPSGASCGRHLKEAGRFSPMACRPGRCSGHGGWQPALVLDLLPLVLGLALLLSCSPQPRAAAGDVAPAEPLAIVQFNRRAPAAALAAELAGCLAGGVAAELEAATGLEVAVASRAASNPFGAAHMRALPTDFLIAKLRRGNVTAGSGGGGGGGARVLGQLLAGGRCPMVRAVSSERGYSSPPGRHR